jgi:glucose/arabinose dehydrogenase
MRRPVALLAASAAVLALAPVAQARLDLALVESGFDSPVHVASNKAEPNRLYVVEQGGLVKIVENGSTLPDRFLDVRSRITSGDERGLLSLAFHPRYPTVRKVYVNFTNTGGDTRVVEYRVNPALTQAVVSTARVLLALHQPYSNHNGGQILFGKDGFLYVPTGDGGAGGDPGNRAQRMSSRLGKLLRINVATKGVKIVAVGLRNPWRASQDRVGGRIWIGDVGQNAREEVDVYRPGTPAIENFGWRRFEGNALYSPGTPLARGTVYVRPKHVYTHGSGGCSITGGFVYRGKAIPRIVGRYFFGDYCTGKVWSFKLVKGRRSGFREHPGLRVSQFLSSFGEGPTGELFVLSHAGGRLYRISGS